MTISTGLTSKFTTLNKAFIAGHWSNGSAISRSTVYNPADQSTVGSVPLLQENDIKEALVTAQKRQSTWGKLMPHERADLLMAWHAQILENKEELAVLMTLEQGKPLGDSRGEISYAASFVKWFAEEAVRQYGRTIPSHLPGAKLSYSREPLGVVALITPWNFPSAMITRKAAAAFAAGCCVISIPSMETPLSALALAKLAEDAGFPPGSFSVLTGDPAVLVGTLCASPVVRGVSFTGSTEIGKLINGLCAPTLKHVSMELGGHAPFIVFPDSNIEQAARAAVDAKFQTNGQDCLAANRIYVHRDIYGDFCGKFLDFSRRLKTGNGLSADTDLGPMMNENAISKVHAQVEDALRKGANLLCGGMRPVPHTLFYPPTVLADVTDDMTITQEETFGPVAALMSFNTEEEVTVRANSTEYGLAAYVFTKNLSIANRMIDKLDFGMIAINRIKLTGAPIPFGGVKYSGLGVEGSHLGIEEYSVIKYSCMDI